MFKAQSKKAGSFDPAFQIQIHEKHLLYHQFFHHVTFGCFDVYKINTFCKSRGINGLAVYSVKVTDLFAVNQNAGHVHQIDFKMIRRFGGE